MHHWRLAALRERTADELGIFVTRLFEQTDRRGVRRSTGIAVASVVPPLTRPMEEMCERYFRPRGAARRRHQCRHPHHATRRRPTSAPTGSSMRSRRATKYGKGAGVPLIVVDFGTATTFDVISREGDYVGGVICPGIGISAEALFQRAARLPRVDVRQPPAVVGQTTVRRDAVGTVLRLRRDGRRAGAPDPQRGARRRAGDRDRDGRARARCCRRRPRASTTSTRT